MRTKVTAVLFSLLFLTAAVAQESRPFILKDPYAVHIELIQTDDRGMDKQNTSDNKPYEAGARIVVGMDAVNTSQQTVRIPILDQWTQDRPELLRSGDKVPYRKELGKVLEALEMETPRGLQVSKLEPGERRRIGYVELRTWYEPLEAGHYQLRIKHRFEPGQDWIGSAVIIFDVLPGSRDSRPQAVGDAHEAGSSITVDTSAITQVSAQKSSDLSYLEGRLVALVHEKLPDWTHETIEPIKGSRDVAIHHWKSREKWMGLTIIRFESVEQATKSIRGFAADLKGRAESPDAGDEQYSMPYHSTIVLRKRHFTVNIDANSVDEKDEYRLIKQFARYIVDAIESN